jgi:prepilin-type processing-associated H-X9-DG protein
MGDQRTLRSAAFNLIELLMVVAVLTLIAAFVLPLLVKRRPPAAHSHNCMINVKQLTLGWLMYATDWGDTLVPNRPYGLPGIPTNNWVAGVMDWTTSPQNTDRGLLLGNGLLSPYIKSAEVYHCPADDSRSAAGPRVRSYSMNAFLGGGAHGPAFSGWKQHTNVSDLLSPVMTFVIVDEHANSIDDGYYVNDPNRTSAWLSLPASRHNGAAVFGFADGHSEIHRWMEASTQERTIPGGPKPHVIVGRGERGADLAWVLSGTTRPETNAASGP